MSEPTQTRMDAVMADAYMDAAAKGLRVAVIGETRASARSAFTRFRDESGAMGADFCSVNGREEIRTPNGGKVLLASRGHSLRGATFDRIYMPLHAQTPEAIEEIFPAIVTSDEPAIVGYV